MAIREVTGMSLSEFAEGALWKPLGAEADATWGTVSRAVIAGIWVAFFPRVPAIIVRAGSFLLPDGGGARGDLRGGAVVHRRGRGAGGGGTLPGRSNAAIHLYLRCNPPPIAFGCGQYTEWS